MPNYSCVLMNGGHKAAIKIIFAMDDGHAVELANDIYDVRKNACTGFEIWKQSSLVHRFEAPK